ncbi:MAG: hypothetical protein AB1446_12405 [Bacillota bacterium]
MGEGLALLPVAILLVSNCLVMRAGGLALEERGRTVPVTAVVLVAHRCTVDGARKVSVLKCETPRLLAPDPGVQEGSPMRVDRFRRRWMIRLLSSPGLSGYAKAILVVSGVEPGVVRITEQAEDPVAWREGTLSLEEFFSRWQLESSGLRPE